MSRPITAFSGDTIYIDTMIFYALLRDIDSTVVKPFFERINKGELHAFTSVLTFDELVYRLLLTLIREQHKGNPLTHLRANEAKMIAAHYPAVADKTTRLQQFPNLSLIDVTSDDLILMNQFILDYQLRPRDALHLTAMRKSGCQNLASNDKDFSRIPSIKRFTLP